MVKNFLKSNGTLPIGLDIIRVISGGIIFSFGLEIFDSGQMAGYIEWLTKVGMPLPEIMAYVGKIAELICGFCLTIGLFTKLSAIPLMITMFVVNFIMLDGNIRQGSFYLLLIFAFFFFVGSGKISIDFLIDKKKSTATAQ
ncbi:MAG: DoxX family protein [Bacteroidota bacterium]